MSITIRIFGNRRSLTLFLPSSRVYLPLLFILVIMPLLLFPLTMRMQSLLGWALPYDLISTRCTSVAFLLTSEFFVSVLISFVASVRVFVESVGCIAILAFCFGRSDVSGVICEFLGCYYSLLLDWWGREGCCVLVVCCSGWFGCTVGSVELYSGELGISLVLTKSGKLTHRVASFAALAVFS